MTFLNKFCFILREIFIIILSTLFIFFGYPLLFLILFSCWVYKKIALNFARKDTKIGKALDGIDAVLAGHDPYSDPLIVLMPYYSLAKKLDVPTVVKVLKEKLIVPKLYPELTQRIVRKFGYHFWYDVDNFKVENHVRYLKPECPNMPITRSELRDMLTNKLGKLPFDSRYSPWEVLVVQNMVDERDPEIKSVFILRVNHCLMDGYSIANFLQKVAFKPWKLLGGEERKYKQINTNKFVDIYKFVVLLFLGPYHALKMLVFSNDYHHFVQNTYKSDCEETYNSQCTPAIPDVRLKSVKKAYRVTMSSLLTTLFTQAAWKFMKRGRIQVPSTIHGLITFPFPGHRDVLSNHWSLVRIPIKVNDADPVKTLKFVEKEFQSIGNSEKPLLFFYANKLMALVPLWLRPSSKYKSPSTFLFTNFPGPTEPSDIFGCNAKHICLGGKISSGVSFIFGSFSLAGKFWLDGGGPSCNVRDQQDADSLSHFVMDTLEKLEKGCLDKNDMHQ